VLSRTMFAGLSQPAYSVLAPNTAGYSADGAVYRASPERALGLFDQAGWTPGPDGIRTRNGTRLSLTIKTLGFNRYPEILQVVQAQWREVGVESRIEQVNIAQLREALNQDDVHVAVNFMPSPDPYVLGLGFHSRNLGNGFNYARVADPELDRLLDDAVAEKDEARRMDLYAQAQRLIMEQALIAPLYVMPHNTVARAEVRGLVRDRGGWDTLLHGVWLEPTRR
jgi:peptide/nickel transport system substrate-binding protein